MSIRENRLNPFFYFKLEFNGIRELYFRIRGNNDKYLYMYEHKLQLSK